MKKILLLPLIITLFCFAKCRKDKLDSNGLPPATQEGRNTLGFMLNGQPWTPKGSRLTGNLSIDFDPGYHQGIFGIVAYNFIPALAEQFIIGIRDSLNFIQSPITLQLSETSLYGISYNKPCDYFNQLNGVQSSGSLIITKLDRTNRIIAGTFNAVLSKSGCETINITEGRFDMKY
jgi:hypothetical protein